MSSKARQTLTENKADLESLWALHAQGRKYGVEVLNKAAVIFVCAAWEAYCEDVVIEAATLMSKDCSNPNSLPGKVRGAIGDKLKEKKDSTNLWRMAGDGWRPLIVEHAREQADALNTPKAPNLIKLFENALGLKAVDAAWKWQGCSNTHAKKKLNDFISLRGEIAHRLKPDQPVHKKVGQGFFSHVAILANFIDESVADHLNSITGKHYW